MSKFINAIEVKMTDEKIFIPPEFNPLMVSETISKSASIPLGDVYDFVVRWNIRIAAEEGIDGKTLSKIKKNVVAELKEIIYGEFRLLAIQAARAAYQHDYKKTIKYLDQILKEII